MSNPNPTQTDNFKEKRQETQIGGERQATTAGAHDGNRPYSIQHSLRYLMAQRINIKNKETIEQYLPDDPTLAQMMAANTITKAIKGDMRAVEFCTDRVDGKVVQPIQEIPASQPYNTGFMTDEEAEAAYREACKS